MFVHNNNLLLRLFGAVLLVALAALPAAAHQGADAVFAAPQAPAASVPQVAATGTIDDLIVDNRVSNVTMRYVVLQLDDGHAVALNGPALDALPKGARVEAIGRNVGNTLFVTETHVVTVGQGRSAKATSAGRATSVQGTLTVFHADYFAEGRGEYGLSIHGDDGYATPLNLAIAPDTLRAGMSVIASGSVAANGFSLDVSNITVLAMPPADFNQIAATLTTNNVLVMAIKFTDSPVSDPFSPTTINTEFQTKVAPFYQEQSFGQQLLNVTLACFTRPVPAGCASHTSAGGWLLSTSATPSGCDYTSVGNLADAAATAAGYNLANYKNQFYIMPDIGCGWAGLAYIGFPYQAWGNGCYQLRVTVHELGHNFTLWPATFTARPVDRPELRG